MPPNNTQELSWNLFFFFHNALLFPSIEPKVLVKVIKFTNEFLLFLSYVKKIFMNHFFVKYNESLKKFHLGSKFTFHIWNKGWHCFMDLIQDNWRVLCLSVFRGQTTRKCKDSSSGNLSQNNAKQFSTAELVSEDGTVEFFREKLWCTT